MSKIQTVEHAENRHSEVENFLQHCSTRVAQELEANFRGRTNSGGLIDAIRYATAGGKKVRPALVYATARTLDLRFEQIDDVACAIELMHAYSLIHDDLPAMDDDDLRRGNPTLHKAFDEATAILAGDAMQTMAFERLACSATLDNRQKIGAIRLLSHTAGTEGMAGGQILDIILTGKIQDIHSVESVHRLKTGSLMSACINIPLECADTQPTAVRRALSDYAEQIGLCFQIRDDILDLNTDACGGNKPTYPATLGVKGAQRELRRISNLCLASLERLGDTTRMLQLLTRYIAERDT